MLIIDIMYNGSIIMQEICNCSGILGDLEEGKTAEPAQPSYHRAQLISGVVFQVEVVKQRETLTVPDSSRYSGVRHQRA